MRKEAGPGIVLADALTEEDVARLAKEGYRTILDLRAPTESPQGDVLAVNEERRAAGDAGLGYENVPVSISEADEELVGRVGERIREAEKPLLVHCSSGKRAGAMTLMNLGVERGMSAGECLQHAASMGFDCESEPAMKSLVVGYLERHSPAHTPGR